MAVKNGLEPRKAVEIILAGSGRNFWVKKFMPDVLAGKLQSGFTLGLLHKDVRLACKLGMESDVAMLFGNLAKEVYQMTMTEMGPQTEVNAVALTIDRLAGTHVVPENYRL